MLRLRGKPLGGQVALGTATLLRAPNGIPLLPARLVAQLARAAKDAPIEPVEVVLVSRDFDAASSLMLPWARVVGIIAENSPEDVKPTGVPTVIGIDSVLERIEDDALVLIDGERGIVLVDPDGMALAAYQAERERIAPRRRIYLDYSHQPAITLDGKPVRVLGRVSTLEEVQLAIENGADTLYVPQDSPLLTDSLSDEEHLDSLLSLAEAAAGKPLTLDWNVRTIAAANVLQAAKRADLTVSVSIIHGGDDFADLQHYLQDTREELMTEDVDFADVRLAGAVKLGQDIPEDLENLFVSRLDVTVPDDRLLEGKDERIWLDGLASAARRMLVPMEVSVPEVTGDAVRTLLGLEASGLIVPAAEVARTKELVRTLDAAECRNELLGRPAGTF